MIGYTAGVFDLLHEGHLRLLKKARTQCDYLIVAVSTDELCCSYKHVMPFDPFDCRCARVAALPDVDRVVPQTELDKLNAHLQYHYDVLFVGSDWRGHPKWQIYEQKLRLLHVKVVYLPYTEGISSTLLRKRIGNFVLREGPDAWTVDKCIDDNETLSLPGVLHGKPVTGISSRAFAFCTSLHRVEMPDTLCTIGNECFYGCEQLMDITLPPSVKRIGSAAFARCGSLEHLTIPPEISELTPYIFMDCDRLQEIRLPANLCRIHHSVISQTSPACSTKGDACLLDHWCIGGKITSERIRLEEGVVGIADASFAGFSRLKEVTLPSSIRHIGNYAFDGCAFWQNTPQGQIVYAGRWAVGAGDDVMAVETITLDKTTIGVADAAFIGCRKADSLHLNSSLRFIGIDAFKGCTALHHFSGSPEACVCGKDAFAYTGISRKLAAK